MGGGKEIGNFMSGMENLQPWAPLELDEWRQVIDAERRIPADFVVHNNQKSIACYGPNGTDYFPIDDPNISRTVLLTLAEKRQAAGWTYKEFFDDWHQEKVLATLVVRSFEDPKLYQALDEAVVDIFDRPAKVSAFEAWNEPTNLAAQDNPDPDAAFKALRNQGQVWAGKMHGQWFANRKVRGAGAAVVLAGTAYGLLGSFGSSGESGQERAQENITIFQASVTTTLAPEIATTIPINLETTIAAATSTVPIETTTPTLPTETTLVAPVEVTLSPATVPPVVETSITINPMDRVTCQPGELWPGGATLFMIADKCDGATRADIMNNSGFLNPDHINTGSPTFYSAAGPAEIVAKQYRVQINTANALAKAACSAQVVGFEAGKDPLVFVQQAFPKATTEQVTAVAADPSLLGRITVCAV